MKACKQCRYIVSVEKTCPKCQGELSEKFSGMVIMMDPERSEIAKTSNINAVGTYAIKVK